MSVQIRLLGTPDEVAAAVSRCGQVLDVVGHSNPRKSRKTPGKVLVYLEAEVVDRSVTR